MSSALEYASDVVGRAIRQADSAADDAGQWLIRVTNGNDGRPIYELVDSNGHIHHYHDDLNILMSRIDGNGGTLGGAEIQALFPNEALTPLQIQALETVPNLQGWVDEGFELSQIQVLALNDITVTQANAFRNLNPDLSPQELSYHVLNTVEEHPTFFDMLPPTASTADTERFITQRTTFLENTTLPSNLPSSTGNTPRTVNTSGGNVTFNDDGLAVVNGNPVLLPDDCTPPCVVIPASAATNPAFANGVYYNEQGFPDFSPYSVHNVRIEGMTGEFLHDAELADIAAGFRDIDGNWVNGGRPSGYTWHHHEDGVTLMLVPSNQLNNFIGKNANGVRHTGGSAILRGQNN